jgi:uncharacterized protein (TIGR02145 family)
MKLFISNELNLSRIFISSNFKIFSMTRYLLLIIYFATLSKISYSQQYGSFTDTRDGRVYKTVKIGSQIWMAENLNSDRFRNGDPIPEAKTDEEWIKAAEEKKPVWCYYNNDVSNGRIYGRIYNWFAVIDPRGLAPKGFHISTKDELITLVNSVGKEDEVILGQVHLSKEQSAVKALKSKFWNDNASDNSSGFSALPGGKRDINFKRISGKDLSSFFIGKEAFWWALNSQTANSSFWTFNFSFSFSSFRLDKHDRENVNEWSWGDLLWSRGNYIRCVKN